MARIDDEDAHCSFAGRGRGDCEHYIGYPGWSVPGQHDGPDDTVDVYGKPNGWCWFCWHSLQIQRLRALLDEAATNPEGDYYTGLHCGVEDRGIYDRYDAADYGWEKAFEYVESVVAGASDSAPAPESKPE